MILNILGVGWGENENRYIFVLFCVDWCIIPQNRSTFHDLNGEYSQTATSADMLCGYTHAEFEVIRNTGGKINHIFVIFDPICLFTIQLLWGYDEN